MANILITGAATGIGFATAVELARAGHTVYATMRNTSRGAGLQEIAARERLAIRTEELDVNSDESVRACFARIASWTAASAEARHGPSRVVVR